MGKININYQNGGIGGVVASTDFISGLIIDSTVLPSGYVSGSTVALYSIKDAEAIGITALGVGETKATGGKITITSGATAGEIVTIKIAPTNASVLTIGSYTVKTADDVSAIASGLNSSINLSPYGFTSTVLAGAITLVAPSKLGASINGAGVITCTSNNTSSTLASTIVNFTGGTGSQIDNMHYIISTFFNANSSTKLWFHVADFTSAYDASKIATIQSAASGEIRQLGIWTKKGLDGIAAIVTASQAIALDQASKKKPLSVVIGAQPGSATIGTLVNLRTLTSPRVSVTIGNAYGTDALGYNLKGITGTFPTDLGSVLGHISRQNVAHSIAWVQQNITENTDIMLVTGEQFKAIEDSVRPDELAAKGYIFERKYFGYAGSYFDNDAVADALTSDYDSVKRMRVMDKVARNAYFSLVPYLSSPLVLDATSGQMSQATVIKFTGVVNQALQSMATAAEVSGFGVYINPVQNVLSTKELVVAITIVPIGSADSITLNLGYALQLQ